MKPLAVDTSSAAVGHVRDPRLYFVHVPKTGGITLKTYLEDRMPLGDALVVHERAARAMAPADLNRFRLWTGHYASDVLDALTPAPDVTLLLVRDPVARLRSWAAHERRSRTPDFPVYRSGMSDAEALGSPQRRYLFQAYWLARALRDGAASTRIPAADELPRLLDRITLVGLTEEIDRFMQLIAFQLGWPPPPVGWKLNARPDADAAAPSRSRGEDEALRALLAVDAVLYDQAAARFWTAYGVMIDQIRPTPATPGESTAAIPVDVVQTWLHAWRARQSAVLPGASTDAAAIDATVASAGEGWWWRQSPDDGVAYRWSGPGPRATLRLPPLDRQAAHDITIEFVGAADWRTWEGLTLSIGGHPLAIVRERFGPSRPGAVNLCVHAHAPAECLAGSPAPIEVVLEVPETRPVPGASLVHESVDTIKRDTRLVGVAFHRLTIQRAARRDAARLLTSGPRAPQVPAA